MNPENNKEKIMKDDEYAMEWLISLIKDDSEISDLKQFSESTRVLLTYAKQCLKGLRDANLKNQPISKSEIENVKKYLSNNNFVNRCVQKDDEKDLSKFNLGILNIENNELEKIKNLSDEDIEKLTKIGTGENLTEQELYPLAEKIKKINRFYNMQLKYGHTARIVFVSKELTNSMQLKNNDLKELLLTSALLHDVGRFYQAQNYDSLLDRSTIKMENKKMGEDTIDDHATAGYYYSMMNSFRNIFESYSRNEDVNINKEVINSIVAAFVVRYHQKSNAQMSCLDLSVTQKNAEALSMKELRGLIENIYENAPRIACHQEHKDYIKTFVKEVLIARYKEENLRRMDAALGIEGTLEDLTEKVAKNIVESQNDKLENLTDKFAKKNDKNEDFIDRAMKYFNTDILDVNKENALIELMNEAKKIFQQDNREPNIEYDKYIAIGLKKLENMAEYDVAKAIYNGFEQGDAKESNSILEKYKTIFSFPLYVTMDADKIDILNQRALGIYPTQYNPKSYSIKLLEEIKGDGIQTDKINYFGGVTENTTLDEIFEQLKIEKLEDKRNLLKMNLAKKENLDDKTLDSMLSTQLTELLQNENIKSNKTGNKRTCQLEIPSKYAYQYYTNKEQKENDDFEQMDIILREQDKENFYKYNGLNNNPYNGTAVPSPVRALLWTMNQFVFTNMRAGHSFQFIKDNQFIEKIYEQYPKSVQDIIKPYMSYTLYFIDQTLEDMKEHNTLLYTSEQMKNNCEKIYDSYTRDNTNILKKYENKLDYFVTMKNIDDESR